MTDNEIIKALGSYTWAKLYHEEGKLPKLDLGEVHDLINRQKAEIERLTHNLEAMAQSFPNCAKAERAEAVKEFAEDVKSLDGNSFTRLGYDGIDDYAYFEQDKFKESVDNLVKEKVGDG